MSWEDDNTGRIIISLDKGCDRTYNLHYNSTVIQPVVS